MTGSRIQNQISQWRGRFVYSIVKRLKWKGRGGLSKSNHTNLEAKFRNRVLVLVQNFYRTKSSDTNEHSTNCEVSTHIWDISSVLSWQLAQLLADTSEQEPGTRRVRWRSKKSKHSDAVAPFQPVLHVFGNLGQDGGLPTTRLSMNHNNSLAVVHEPVTNRPQEFFPSVKRLTLT